MSLNPYAPCPCGSGKKLKFCCVDLAGDIEKIHRMIEGDQPHAALRHVEQTLARNPQRASLLDFKSIIELSLGDFENAAATVERFLAAHPDSPAALANQALLLSQTKGGAAAIMPLQKAIALVARDMPRRVLEAIGSVGHSLLAEGHVVAGQAHLWFYLSIAPKSDSRALELLVGLYRSAGLPILLRDRLMLRDWTSTAPWLAEARQASDLAERGRWYEATMVIDDLGQQYGPDPSLLYNRAVLGGWLADERALVAGLHAFAQLDVPLDDAIEAEAIAQLLDSTVNDPTIDTLKLTYDVRDIEALEVRLADAGQLERYDFDVDALVAEGTPRPRHTFLLLDRSPPMVGTDIERDQVPRVLGFVTVFGRQTDRAERLELVIDRGESFDTALEALLAVCGDTLGERSGEDVVGHSTEVEQALSWRWQFPVDTPPTRRRELLTEERHDAIVHRWPDVPRAVLAGKTPRQASSEPEFAVTLAALVLILEQGSNNADQAVAIQRLRAELGLPDPAPIVPTDEQLNKLPLVRAGRVDFSQVSDDALTGYFHRAAMTDSAVAIRQSAREALRRTSMAEKIPPNDAFRQLIRLEPNTAVALEIIEEARRRSQEADESTAVWDILELETHLGDANVDEVKRMMQLIDERHRDNPEVAAAVYRLLYEVGLIQPDEVVGQQPIPDSWDEIPTEETQVQESRIWTPGDELAATPGQKKSQLWTPS